MTIYPDLRYTFDKANYTHTLESNVRFEYKDTYYIRKLTRYIRCIDDIDRHFIMTDLYRSFVADCYSVITCGAAVDTDVIDIVQIEESQRIQHPDMYFKLKVEALQTKAKSNGIL